MERAANYGFRLQFKSQGGPTGSATESSTVLCTPDKTYNLRQVSTSNTLYIAQPSFAAGDTLERPGLEAIAQVHSTLELQPSGTSSAVPYIKAALPMYASTGHYEPKDAMTKESLFAIIPLSDAECQQSWLKLVCFETGQPPRAFVPSVSAKLKVWQDILAAATANGVDLSDHDAVSKLLPSVTNDDLPEELYKAVICSTMEPASGLNGDGMTHEIKCSRFVGLSLLEDRTKATHSTMSVDAFKSAWADMLPEKWRSLADVNLLESACRFENNGRSVSFVEVDPSITADSGTPAEAKGTLGAKRRWHEKFRAAKKTA